MMKPLPLITLEQRSETPGRPVKMEWVPLRDLRIDERYQRDVTTSGLKHIRNIAKNFAWRKFAPVIVTWAETGTSTYAIIDGQHRCMAALALGYDLVPCAIVDANVEDAASIFAAVNGTTLKVHAVQVFKAGLAAREPWALMIKQACDATGVIPLVYPVQAQKQKPFMTMSAGRLRRLVEKHGVSVLTAVLRIVVAMPYANVPGFICSRTLDSGLQKLSAERAWRECPAEAADRVLNGRAMQVVPVATLIAGEAPVVPVNMSDDAALIRVQDLKTRGFTKSMVAASLKLRYAQVEKLWGGV
jgi:ParB-like nuclease domain